MKFGTLALILVCVSMSLAAQTQPPSTVRANDGRTAAIHVLIEDIGTGKTTLCRTVRPFSPTTFTALIVNPFSWVKELLRELLLRYGIALKETLRSLIDASSSAISARQEGSLAVAIAQHWPTKMSSSCKGFPTS
jgi:hypothetical protein